MDTQHAVIDVFAKIFAVYNLILIIAAIVLNPMIIYVCLRSSKLRSTSTFKMLTVGAVNDLLCSLAWTQECFTNTFFNLQPQSRSLFYCQWISVFLQLTTFEIASWNMVSISLDRLLSLSLKKWSKSYFNGIKPYVYTACLMFVIAAINFVEVFNSGYISYDDNGTEIIICYANPPDSFPWYNTMSQVLVYFGYIVPYGLLIVFNAMIIYKATTYERTRKRTQVMSLEQENHHSSSIASRAYQRKLEMTKTILFITFLYIVTSLASTLITAYFYNQIISDYSGQMVINLVDGVLFSYPAFNFFILFFSNKLFSQEVRSLIVLGRQTSVSAATQQSNQTNTQAQANRA